MSEIESQKILLAKLDKLKKDPVSRAKKIKINDLVDILKYANEKYRLTNELVLSDDMYDLFLEILEQRDPNHEFLSQIGIEISDAKKVKLPVPMPSLNKKKEEKLILAWIKKYGNGCVISDKLDGISALISHGKKLFTRGDGIYGGDKSKFIEALSIPTSLLKPFIIRGELIINKKNAKQYLKKKTKTTNARSLVAGFINSKKVNEELASIVDFVAYEILEPRMKPSEQFKVLKSLNLNVVYHIKVPSENINLNYLQTLLKERRENSKYDIDGIVLSNNKTYALSIENPKHAFAFKMILDDQIKETEVLDVEWNLSKDGIFKPRIKLKMIEIGGSKINYTTGFNAKYIKENKINKGTKVEIIKSGDVIPYITRIIEESKTPLFPKIDFKWTDSGVDIYLENFEDNREVILKRLQRFFDMMNVEFVSGGIIKKLMMHGFDDLKKILKITKEDLLKIEGFKERLADKIVTNIAKAIKSVNLSRVVIAANLLGPGFGEKKLKLILSQYPNIFFTKDKISMIKQKIKSLEGFSDKTTNVFVENIPKVRKFLNTHKMIEWVVRCNKKNESIVELDDEETNEGNETTDSKKQKKQCISKLHGKKIVFTGIRDKNIEDKIEECGGEIMNTVSKKINILVAKDTQGSSSKLTKAKEYNIEILDLDEFKKKYMD